LLHLRLIGHVHGISVTGSSLGAITAMPEPPLSPAVSPHYSSDDAQNAGTEKMLTFLVPEMHCDGCIRSLTKAVQALDENATLTADLQARRVTVQTSAASATVVEAFEDAGFDVEPAA
jgi:copper chaperone